MVRVNRDAPNLTPTQRRTLRDLCELGDASAETCAAREGRSLRFARIDLAHLCGHGLADTTGTRDHEGDPLYGVTLRGRREARQNERADTKGAA